MACKLTSGDHLGASDLPDNTVLGAHVDLNEFHSFRFQLTEDWEKEMPTMKGWRAQYHDDHRYKMWRDAQAKKRGLF
jgi:hypothetical protein